RLIEIQFGMDRAGLLGNIYRARIQKVLPAMQAAFVDGGAAGSFYLYIDDALPPGWKEERGKPKPNISELVREGEERFVQVYKEAVGSKSPSVTLDVGLPGRMLVYQPFAGYVSVSRKVGDEAERKRLRQMITPMLQGTEGVIVRTQAEGADSETLAGELAFLRGAWSDALDRAKGSKTPALVTGDTDPLLKMIRDTVEEELDQIVIEGFEAFQRTKRYGNAFMPKLGKKLIFHQGKQSLFDRYGIDAQLEQAMARVVTLPSGGSLVIDQTEAMTVIDVNTGKFTGKAFGSLEETVTRTNVEAAHEIARQLRLRDIGGIILIDFIDMKKASNRDLVQTELEARLASDRSPANVLGYTRLGIMEMTRKKSRQTLTQVLTRPCPSCLGRGRVLSEEELLLRIERELTGIVKAADAQAAVIELPAGLSIQETDLVERLTLKLFLFHDPALLPDQYRITYVGSLAEAQAKADRLRQK
ncbi:MAG: Rne/Rng family ribonuclease, partial [Clostridia bacterium]